MWNEDLEDQGLSVEAQVALLMGDPDADELIDEVPSWRVGGTVAKRAERDRLSFDTSAQPNNDWSN